MTRFLFVNNISPEFADLLATRPITIHEFHSTGIDCLNKTILCKWSSLKYFYYRRPIGDPSETDMPDRRHIGDRHASSIRHVGLRSGVLVSDETYWSPIGLRSGMLVFDGSPIRHVGLQWGMSVSNGSSMKHVGLRWVFNEAWRSPTGFRSGMSISNGSSIGIWWVSDGSLIGLL